LRPSWPVVHYDHDVEVAVADDISLFGKLVLQIIPNPRGGACGKLAVPEPLLRNSADLNETISSKIRIAGPYWGLNLVLWAKGLVDHPAIGIGSGYQYFLTGSPGRPPKARLALPSLRRRVGVTPQLGTWLEAALRKLTASHPAYAEFNDIRKQYTTYSQLDAARAQVAGFYKRWIETIAGVPKLGRSMALFQDLSVAYALGRSLPQLPDEGTARRPEAIAEPLMLRCL
jgi:hypothetical protein